MLPVKRAMRQRPLDLRSSWKCQGRASAWLRTLTEGMRMPRVRSEARGSCDVAEVVLGEETSVPSPWVVEELCLATRREGP
jgi:hypothetical protein